MKKLVLLAAIFLAGAVVPAAAEVAASTGLTGAFRSGGYDAERPCVFYRMNDLPAPKRCHRHFFDYYGHAVYEDGEFIFRSEASFQHWQNDAGYKRWRSNDFSGGHGTW